MKKKLTVFLMILLLPFFIWGSAILKCEVLTYQHGKEFDKIYKENTMIGEIDYLKILEYTDRYARVYYVSENRASGNVLKFVRNDNIWRYNSWERTVWSKMGSASDVIWPYWWHFIYGGF